MDGHRAQALGAAPRPARASPRADTRVTVELRDEDGKTRLTLTHEGFPSREHRDLAGGGWPGFLDRIEALLR